MHLEKYDEIKKWITQVKDSSKATYLSAIKAYIEFTGLNPKELIDEAEEDRKKPRRQQGKPEERLAEFHKWLLTEYEVKTRGKNRKPSGRKGISKMMATTYVGAIRSFYRRNGFPIMTKTPKAAPKKENRKMSLTPREVKLLVDHAPTLRDRAIILFMFQGGFDASTICSLNYGDVKRGLERGEVPLLIEVVREKDEVEYFTFVGYDAVEALKAYLNDRKRKGEELKLYSPLFAKEGAKKLKHERITPNLIQNMLRETALKAGLISEEDLENADLNPCRPHALRAAFSTILRLNGFDPLLVDFMQGHRIPYNGAYLIPPPERVRQMYAELEPQLSISSMHPVERRVEEKLKAYRDDIAELQNEVNELRRLVEILMTSVLDIGDNKMKTQELVDRVAGLVKQPERVIKLSEIEHYSGEKAKVS